ncbi:MAG: MBOAT family O-acyltransferase [Trueperaceae bacterium]
MIFSSIDFFVFFAVVLVFLAVVKSNPVKKMFLLAASYFFYGYWDWRFVFLMFAMTVANYIFGQRIEATNDEKQRRFWLVMSVITNLAVLGVFKYFNFFLDTANTLLASLDIRFPYLNILLPVGISFIIFEVMSYTIDIYRRENKSTNTFYDLALLVAFFPHLIAGPILKPKDFLPQLEQPILIRLSNIILGSQIFLVGLVKKVLVADRLALFIDPVFANPASYDSLTVWLAVFSYALQIYCDFSGYTDMAIGSARIMGFDIPMNFNFPYVSKNITEFWRRWHISLSSWLRDYLYISLGGNRKGETRTYINLMLVMLLGGLWHGASWNFVVWGGLHGVALAIHRAFSGQVKERVKNGVSPFITGISWLVTFIFVCTAWVFFRSADFGISWAVIQKMYALTDMGGVNWMATALFIAVPIFFLADWADGNLRKGKQFNLVGIRGLFVVIFVAMGVFFLAPENPAPFIYFQF